ncbi:uncharacterized protein FRV6_03950 [Fusarium oxysporum]|uniref:Uncharacterized protein n=1 Tax=Fusarium oxysporum TaxID=5507 RepID=A0A2H3STH8_FUSOX|nr:uncharacterized protein FRV6_03950 [Fusarium oxysporum]
MDLEVRLELGILTLGPEVYKALHEVSYFQTMNAAGVIRKTVEYGVTYETNPEANP